jgi:hypothetical protein
VAQYQGFADGEIAHGSAMVIMQVGTTDAAKRHGDANLAGNEGAVSQVVDAQILLSVANSGKHSSGPSAITVTKGLWHG